MISHEDQAYRHGDSAEKEVESRSEFLRILLYELNSAIAPRQARLEAIHAVLREFARRILLVHLLQEDDDDERSDTCMRAKKSFHIQVRSRAAEKDSTRCVTSRIR